MNSLANIPPQPSADCRAHLNDYARSFFNRYWIDSWQCCTVLYTSHTGFDTMWVRKRLYTWAWTQLWSMLWNSWLCCYGLLTVWVIFRIASKSGDNKLYYYYEWICLWVFFSVKYKFDQSFLLLWRLYYTIGKIVDKAFVANVSL